MSMTTAPAPFSRLALLGLAGGIAAALTLAAAELMPARSLGPIAGTPALAVAPTRADVDHAHRAFEPFRDRPDHAGEPRTVALAASSTGD